MRLNHACAAESAIGAIRDICLQTQRHRLSTTTLQDRIGYTVIGGIAAALLALLPNPAYAESTTLAEAESSFCSIEPKGAHISGGIEVTLHSREFLPPNETQIFFGDTPASITRWGVYGYECLYSYSCIVPPHEEGKVDISIVAPNRDTEVIHHAFDYYARAQLNLLNSSGGVSGMNVVNISGAAFLPPLQVYFDDTPATVVSVEPNYLTCLSPPHAPGVVDVYVINADGVSSDDTYDNDDGYTYKLPSVLSVWPRAAPSFTPNKITIYGAGFSGAGMKVLFGGVEAQDLIVESSTAMTCRTPLGISGPVHVMVQDPSGHSVAATQEFNFLDSWESVIHGYHYDFNSSTTDGIDDILIKGENLIIDGDYEVFFGDTPATGIRVTHDVNLYCNVPAHEAGTVEVTVKHDGRTTLVPGGWTYYEETPRPEADRRDSVIGLDDSVTGNNAGAITDSGTYDCWWQEDCDCTDDESDLHYTVSSLESGTLSVRLCSDAGDKTLRAYKPSGLLVACADGAQCSSNPIDEAQIQIPIMPCTPYTLRVASMDGMPGGPFTLTTDFEADGMYSVDPVENDEPAGAIPMFNGVAVALDLKCATLSNDVNTSIPGADTWYLFDAEAAGNLSVSICGEDAEVTLPSITVHGQSMNEIGAGTPESCEIPVLATLPAAGSYLLRVVRESNNQGTYTMVANFTALPGDGEGATDGEVEGATEGVSEGAGEGAIEGVSEGGVDGEVLEGSSEGEVPLPEHHSADVNEDSRISLGELLRVIQLRNAGAVHCAPGSEDGYAPGTGDTECSPHTADYAPQDWGIALDECLRVIQIYNGPGYFRCDTGEDGFCI